MEIYVVTAGSYSDYHIQYVFTDKEKAQKYVDLHSNDSWDTPEIEIYESIEEDLNEIKCVAIRYKIQNMKLTIILK